MQYLLNLLTEIYLILKSTKPISKTDVFHINVEHFFVIRDNFIFPLFFFSLVRYWGVDMTSIDFVWFLIVSRCNFNGFPC